MFRTIQSLDVAAGTSVVVAGLVAWHTGWLASFVNALMVILVVTAVVLRLIVPAYNAGAASQSRRPLAAVHDLDEHRKKVNA